MYNLGHRDNETIMTIRDSFIVDSRDCLLSALVAPGIESILLVDASL
jgi:hypothetical protein